MLFQSPERAQMWFFRNFWTLHSWTASMNTHVMSFLHMSSPEMISSAPHPMTIDCEGLSTGKTPNINPWSTTPEFNNRVRAYFDRKSSLFYHYVAGPTSLINERSCWENHPPSNTGSDFLRTKRTSSCPKMLRLGSDVGRLNRQYGCLRSMQVCTSLYIVHSWKFYYMHAQFTMYI